MTKIKSKTNNIYIERERERGAAVPRRGARAAQQPQATDGVAYIYIYIYIYVYIYMCMCISLSLYIYIYIYIYTY